MWKGTGKLRQQSHLVQRLHDGRDLLQVDGSRVVHVVEPEGPLELLALGGAGGHVQGHQELLEVLRGINGLIGNI